MAKTDAGKFITAATLFDRVANFKILITHGHIVANRNLDKTWTVSAYMTPNNNSKIPEKYAVRHFETFGAMTNWLTREVEANMELFG